jgi:hypothetical protein
MNKCNPLAHTRQISLKIYSGILLIFIEKIQFWFKLEEVTYNLQERVTYVYNLSLLLIIMLGAGCSL